MNGRERLREQLEAMGHALQAFDDPLVDEHAGLRLMRDVLAARRDHIAEELPQPSSASWPSPSRAPPAAPAPWTWRSRC